MAGHHGRRIQGRWQRVDTHSRKRRSLGRSKGQTIVIFALSLTVLIALVGLAIDVLRVYDLYARMERAAEAGSLAGVIYMPNYYAVADPSPSDGNSAVSRALQETIKNGFGTAHAAAYSDCPNPPDPTKTTSCSACPNPPAAIPVAVCPVRGKPSDLRVTITQTINVVFLGLLGVGPTTISASAQAEYLPIIQMGSRASYFGDQVECISGGSTSSCSTTASGTHLQYFMATMDGPAELKESGDPMVYCAEGPSEINGPDANISTYTYNDYPTNHRPWSDAGRGVSSISQYCGVPTAGGSHGNEDYQPSGYDGPMTDGTAHPGGYNYQIYVGSGTSSASVWVYNANYVPTDSSSLPPDRFIDAGSQAPSFYKGPLGEGIGSDFDGSHYDAPLFYFNTTFTIYKVNSLYDRTQDTLVSSTTYQPYDDISDDESLHRCTSSQVYSPFANNGTNPNFYHNASRITSGTGCVSKPSCMLAWCKLPISGGLAPGTYRLVVEATGLSVNASPDYISGTTDGWGQHSYGLKVCASNSVTTPVGCSDGGNGSTYGPGQLNFPGVAIFAWNNMDITIQATLSTASASQSSPATSCIKNNSTPYACLDLACITSEYAGRTVSVRLFDVGDGNGSGSLYVSIVPPSGSGATVSYASWATTATINGYTAVQTKSGSSRPYNGLWLDAVLTLPPSYTGTCATQNSGWWQIMYASNDTQPTDKIAVEFSLVGSPTHLVAVG